MYRAPVSMVRQQRYRAQRPIRRPVGTPTYGWVTVTVKVWAIA